MKTIILQSAMPKLKDYMLYIVAFLAPFLLIYLGRELQVLAPTIGLLDAGAMQLLLLSILAFLGLTTLSWWLLQRAWASLGLPKIKQMVSHFKNLTLWQQFVFYWASFALLLLAAILTLVAVF